MTESNLRTCEYGPCGEVFTPRRPHQRFHSEKCRYEQWLLDNGERGESGAQRVGAGDSHAPPTPRPLKQPTDCERIAAKLKVHLTAGIHSHELRKLGFSGNPSQRIAELEDQGYEIKHVREHKGRRPGTRYFLISEPDSGTAGTSSDRTGEGTAGFPLFAGTLDRPRPSRTSGDSNGAPLSAADPGEDSAGEVPSGAAPTPVEPARLFADEAPQSLNPLSDVEAA